jgi:hypothetical protein
MAGAALHLQGKRGGELIRLKRFVAPPGYFAATKPTDHLSGGRMHRAVGGRAC